MDIPNNSLLLFDAQLYREVDKCSHMLGTTALEFIRQAVQEKVTQVGQQYADEWEAYCKQYDDDWETFHNS